MRLPNHVAIIMDGNGRWAKSRHLPRTSGHKAGMKVARDMTIACAQKGIQTLSLFAFGYENWQRPEREVHFLMNLFVEGLSREMDALQKNNVQLRIIGDHEQLSDRLKHQIKEASMATANNTGLQLVIALNYSGRWDILSGVKKLMAQVEQGHIKSTEINETLFSNYLSTMNIPDPDLLIRTSGEQRMSNFMLWQCAYTEFYFTQTMWPDFDSQAFEEALTFFASRERRFGKITEQL